MSNKQSSIEWLIDQRKKYGSIIGIDLEQAKEMERELIKESCIMAIMQWNEWDKTNYLDLYDHKIEGAEIWAEDYCKELYEEIEVPNLNFNKMTPKEKAEELFYEMSYNSSDEDHHCSHYVARNFSLIAVDAILTVAKEIATKESVNYWNKVKQEIQKL